jgi:hypothetical protein
VAGAGRTGRREEGEEREPKEGVLWEEGILILQNNLPKIS